MTGELSDQTQASTRQPGVRLAEPGDLERVGDITFRAYLADGFLREGSDYGDHLRDAATRAREAELWVAVDDGGTVLGSVTFCTPGSPYRELATDTEGEFRMLAVDPDARGLGIGRLLALRCIERSREIGYTGVAICSLPEMRTAHALYRSLGFERDEDRDWEPASGIVLWGFTLRFS